MDVTEPLTTAEGMRHHLAAALVNEDPQVFLVAVGDVVRSLGAAEIARKSGINRVTLYTALSITGNPKFDTVRRVLAGCGYQFTIEGQSK